MDEPYCVQDIGLNSLCGEEAVATRDGWPLCQGHVDRWDYFDRISAEGDE